MKNIYDVVILGAGPAGLSAAIYAGRAKMKCLMIEKLFEGGQLAITADIENYPGSPENDTGPQLIARMVNQVEQFGVERVYDTIEKVDFKSKLKVVYGADAEYYAHSIIIATGAFPKALGCPGEKEFIGKGVSYCATCDGAFFAGLDAYVVGGGNSAVEEAIFLTKFAKKVTIIHRRDELRASKAAQEAAFANPKIEFLFDSVITEIKGDFDAKSILVQNLKTNTITEYGDKKGIGIFVFVGFTPNSSIFENVLPLENGYIKTDENMQTALYGVFAAGDIRVKSLRQVITAAADGAIAATQAMKYAE